MVLQNLTRRSRALGGLLGGGNGAGLRRKAVGARPNTTKFPKTMIIGGTAVTFNDGRSLVAGDFNPVVFYKVQAQEKATFGVANPSIPDNQGYVYFRIQTSSPAAIDGAIRFMLEGAQGEAIPGGLVLEEDTTRLDGSQTDRQQQIPLPEWPIMATEDSRLMVRVDPTSTATVEEEDSIVQIPITIERITE